MHDGSTALSKAIQAAVLVRNTEAVTVLLDAGADPSIYGLLYQWRRWQDSTAAGHAGGT
jgi:hypothetical protein